MEEFRVKFDFDHCFSVDRVGRSGCLAVLWKNFIQCQISRYSHHHIDVIFSENNNVSWHLSCYYGHPERTKRRESWHLIRNLANISPLPWCIWGDFNDMMHASEKKGKHSHPQSLLDGFHNVIEECSLSELNLSGGKFTWEKSRGSSNWVREKLDRGYATMSWCNKFLMYNLKILHASVSDHEPIMLELCKPDISLKVFRLCFEKIWLKEPKFVKDISTIWNTIPVSHLLPKLIEVSSFMARWRKVFLS
ncbi:uncharacterized protein LOC141697724 [Apium graveolens]|uniref:uncharacterized protein LOC141697724 n=1 Tax=Apium graveolens TaxID=4045 RepID=UPI003D7B005F